jgi:hypothetical protein
VIYKTKGIIQDFAIGGGIAVLYYTEPLLTYDLDIYFVPIKEGLDVLAPIYSFLKKRGYITSKEHILVKGVPVQFIPVYNDLVKDAVMNSRKVIYGRLKTNVIGLEYLIAIMLQTYRPKDRERLVIILEETEFDSNLLRSILKKYDLYDKFNKFRSVHFGKN